MNIGDWVGAYGAVLSTITAGWAVWREARDRHRFDVHVAIAEICAMDDRTNVQLTLVGGSITNIGTRTAYVKSIGALLKNDRQLGYLLDPRFPTHYSMPALPYELAPGQSCDFRLPLNLLTNPDVVAFIAYDSHGKEWRAPRKKFRDAVKSAKAK